jgi:hypothetical protein
VVQAWRFGSDHAKSLCIGFDSADAVSHEYSGSNPFKGGTIKFVGVTVEKKQYLDLENEAAGAFSRD